MKIGKHIVTFKFEFRARSVCDEEARGAVTVWNAAPSLIEFALQSFHSPHAASLWDHSVSHTLGSVQIFSRSFSTALPPMPLGSKN